LLKSFCDQLGCEPDEAEKVARRLAFLMVGTLDGRLDITFYA
jgi:hypothetical protein